MQDPPFPPGSYWLAKAWNEQFELGAIRADVQTFPGDISPSLPFNCNFTAQHAIFASATVRSVMHAAWQLWF